MEGGDLDILCAMQLEEDLRVLRNEVMRSGETGVQLPVNFRRLIWNAQQIFKCRPHRPGASGASSGAACRAQGCSRRRGVCG